MKKTETTKNTEKNLREAFWKLYRERKDDHVSVKAITELAGYHRSTFYEYYKDSHNLLETIEEELLDRFESLYTTIFNSADGRRIVDMIPLFFELHNEMGEYLYVLLGENGDLKFRYRLKDMIFAHIADFIGLDLEDARARLTLEYLVSGGIAVSSACYQMESAEIGDIFHVIRSHFSEGGLSALEPYSSNKEGLNILRYKFGC